MPIGACWRRVSGLGGPRYRRHDLPVYLFVLLCCRPSGCFFFSSFLCFLWFRGSGWERPNLTAFSSRSLVVDLFAFGVGAPPLLPFSSQHVQDLSVFGCRGGECFLLLCSWFSVFFFAWERLAIPCPSLRPPRAVLAWCYLSCL